METALQRVTRKYKEISDEEKNRIKENFSYTVRETFNTWKTSFENDVITRDQYLQLKQKYLGDELAYLDRSIRNTTQVSEYKLKEKIVLHFEYLNLIDSYEISEEDDQFYDGDELSPKEKLILLDKLGIIDCLTAQLVEPDNASHLADIIQRFTGIKISKASLKGYCNFLVRRNHSPNSPYGSTDAVEKATRIYNTFRLKDKTN